MIALLFMWMGISFPLVFIGYFFGSRKQVSSRLFSVLFSKTLPFQLVGMLNFRWQYIPDARFLVKLVCGLWELWNASHLLYAYINCPLLTPYISLTFKTHHCHFAACLAFQVRLFHFILVPMHKSWLMLRKLMLYLVNINRNKVHNWLGSIFVVEQKYKRCYANATLHTNATLRFVNCILSVDLYSSLNGCTFDQSFFKFVSLAVWTSS